MVAKKLVKKSTKIAKNQVTHFVFLVDRSGSMMHIRRPTLKVINEQIDAIRGEAAKTKQKATGSFVSFGTNVKHHFLQKDIASLKAIPEEEYRPDGSTPLLDAIGSTINKLWDKADGQNVSYMFVIVTDGEENSSHTFDAKDVQKLLRETQATDRWSFAFLLPGEVYKKNFVKNFGIPEGNCQVWDATEAGVKRAGMAMTKGVSNYMSLRASGQTCTRGFFTTDMSDVKAKDLKNNLVNLKNDVKVAVVPRELPIREFCEAEFGEYQRGAAFYCLTKDEKAVQGYKKVLIMEKGKSAVFGGDDAREVLGLPDSTTPVRPGNHSNFDIFIQSTSVNRKLVRGTKVLYYPDAAL